MKNASMTYQAAEAMAFHAYKSGRTLQDLYGSAYHVDFLTRGHHGDESIERSVNVTPELVERAQAILDKWNAS